MVAIKKFSRQKKPEGEDTSWHITHGANAPNGTFLTLDFATVRESKGRDCLVAKTIYFNITKLLRPSNDGAQNPYKSIEFAILSRRGHQVNRAN